jgi:hypothetical protein
LSAVGFIVGLMGIYHYGYMGQDFLPHRDLVLTFPGSYNYHLTNPPGLYWFGSLIHNHFSAAHYLEFIALASLILNGAALWIIYGFLWSSIAQWQLRYSAAALVTLIPFRVIHSVVLAADAFTLPIFALAAIFTLRLFENPGRVSSWIWLSLSLSAGMFFKYTFAGLFPPIALLVGIAILRRLKGASRFNWIAIGILALALPTAIFAIQWREIKMAGGDVAVGQWLPKGAPSIMRWSDILTLQKSDLRVLSAPEYLRDKLYGFRTFSYMGLVHVSSFTDVSNFFQPPPKGVSTKWSERRVDPFERARSSFSQALQVSAVRLGMVFSVLAVIGTIFCLCLGAAALLLWKPVLPNETLVMTALAAGFYSTVFLSLHRLLDPYTPGFWLPRLVLPGLLVFFGLGFVLLDFACRLARHQSSLKPFLLIFAAYTAATCLLFIGFLC